MSHKRTKPRLFWEISASAPGAEVTECVSEIPDVLNFCARVFFANILFDAQIVTIRHAERQHPDALGFYFLAESVQRGGRLMKVLFEGQVHCHWFENLDQAFRTLTAELNSGWTKMEQICSHKCACPDDDPVPGGEGSTFPFA